MKKKRYLNWITLVKINRFTIMAYIIISILSTLDPYLKQLDPCNLTKDHIKGEVGRREDLKIHVKIHKGAFCIKIKSKFLVFHYKSFRWEGLCLFLLQQRFLPVQYFKSTHENTHRRETIFLSDMPQELLTNWASINTYENSAPIQFWVNTKSRR